MQEVKNACVILNTAEYCQSTSIQVRPRLASSRRALEGN